MKEYKNKIYFVELSFLSNTLKPLGQIREKERKVEVKMNFQDLKNDLTYLHSEINRIETMAGTLTTIENEHYKRSPAVESRLIFCSIY